MRLCLSWIDLRKKNNFFKWWIRSDEFVRNDSLREDNPEDIPESITFYHRPLGSHWNRLEVFWFDFFRWIHYILDMFAFCHRYAIFFDAILLWEVSLEKCKRIVLNDHYRNHIWHRWDKHFQHLISHRMHTDCLGSKSVDIFEIQPKSIDQKSKTID